MDEKLQNSKQLFVYEEDAGRFELFIRIIYAFCISLVLGVYGFIASICLFVQWWVVLIFGRMNYGLSEFIRGYMEYQVYVMAYMNLMTDKRPNIMPVPVDIFESER